MNKKLLPILLIALLTLSGCVVTERQIETEQSLGELNTLALKLKTATEELKATTEENSNILAEISADMDTLQQDFGDMRGGFETRENSLQKVEANFDLLSDAISTLDESMKELDEIKERLLRVESPLGEGEDKTDLGLTLLELQLSIEEIKKAAIEHELKEKELKKEAKKKEAKKEKKQGKEKGPDPKNLYLEGLDAVKVNKDYVKGLETLHLFLKLYPKHELADNAQYWIAEVHYDRGEWERAAVEFNYVVKNYPKADKVPAALLKQAFSFEKMKDKETSVMILEKLIKDYPKSGEATEAKKHLNKDTKKKTTPKPKPKPKPKINNPETSNTNDATQKKQTTPGSNNKTETETKQ